MAVTLQKEFNNEGSVAVTSGAPGDFDAVTGTLYNYADGAKTSGMALAQGWSLCTPSDVDAFGKFTPSATIGLSSGIMIHFYFMIRRVKSNDSQGVPLLCELDVNYSVGGDWLGGGIQIGSDRKLYHSDINRAKTGAGTAALDKGRWYECIYRLWISAAGVAKVQGYIRACGSGTAIGSATIPGGNNDFWTAHPVDHVIAAKIGSFVVGTQATNSFAGKISRPAIYKFTVEGEEDWPNDTGLVTPSNTRTLANKLTYGVDTINGNDANSGLVTVAGGVMTGSPWLTNAAALNAIKRSGITGYHSNPWVLASDGSAYPAATTLAQRIQRCKDIRDGVAVTLANAVCLNSSGLSPIHVTETMDLSYQNKLEVYDLAGVGGFGFDSMVVIAPGSWTKTGGYTSVYETTDTAFQAVAFYYTVPYLGAKGMEWTPKTSLANYLTWVDAQTNGAFHNDYGAGTPKLYVKLPGGADPRTVPSFYGIRRSSDLRIGGVAGMQLMNVDRCDALFLHDIKLCGNMVLDTTIGGGINNGANDPGDNAGAQGGYCVGGTPTGISAVLRTVQLDWGKHGCEPASVGADLISNVDYMAIGNIVEQGTRYTGVGGQSAMGIFSDTSTTGLKYIALQNQVKYNQIALNSLSGELSTDAGNAFFSHSTNTTTGIFANLELVENDFEGLFATMQNCVTGGLTCQDNIGTVDATAIAANSQTRNIGTRAGAAAADELDTQSDIWSPLVWADTTFR